jgi:esterase/lipase
MIFEHQNKKIAPRVFFVLKKITITFVMVYCGVGVIFFIFQKHYVYHPDKTDFYDCPAFAPAEKIEHNGTRGYFLNRSTDRLVVFYHGNAGRACDRAYLDPHFEALGYSSLFVEYVGYGQDEYGPHMSGILDNVEDMINFIHMRQFREVVVIGESIGVGPAAYHARNASIDHLVLISPYDNMASVARQHYPFYPMRLLLRENFTPDVWLQDHTGSVSLIVAQNDDIIPRNVSDKLYTAIPSEDKEMLIVKDSGHNTMYEQREFYDHLRAVLQ